MLTSTAACVQAMTCDKLRSSASAEMAVTTEALRETELTDDDAASLGGSPRVSVNFDRGLEPSAAWEEHPQVLARLACFVLPYDKHQLHRGAALCTVHETELTDDGAASMGGLLCASVNFDQGLEP